MIFRPCDEVGLAQLVERVLRDEQGVPGSLGDYVGRRPEVVDFLPESRRGAFVAHLRTCATCDRRFRDQLGIARFLKKAELKIPDSYGEEQLQGLGQRIARRAALRSGPQFRGAADDSPGTVRGVVEYIRFVTKEILMSDEMAKTARFKWFFSGAAIALCLAAAVYFAVLRPGPTGEEAAGTMGGVEKADRYRSEQMSGKDITVQTADSAKVNEQIQKIIESVDFQKIVKSNAAAAQGAAAAAAQNPSVVAAVSSAVDNSMKDKLLFLQSNSAQFLAMQKAIQQSAQDAVQSAIQQSLLAAIQDSMYKMSYSSMQNLVSNNQAYQNAILNPSMQSAIADALFNSMNQAFFVQMQSSMQGFLVQAVDQLAGISAQMNQLQSAVQAGIQSALSENMSQIKDSANGIVRPQLQAALNSAILNGFFYSSASDAGVVSAPAAVGAAAIQGGYVIGLQDKMQSFLSTSLLQNMQSSVQAQFTNSLNDAMVGVVGVQAEK